MKQVENMLKINGKRIAVKGIMSEKKIDEYCLL